MKRRAFITLLGGAAAWPVVARGQKAGIPIIGYLDPGNREQNAELVSAFRAGLAERGLVEGRNVEIEYRWAEAQYARLPELAADLVAHRVSVIAATNGIPTVLAAKAATTRIPIGFFVGSDPVALRLT